MTSHLFTLPQGSKRHGAQSDFYQSVLLASGLHLLVLLGVANTVHLASGAERNELTAIAASFDSPPNETKPIQKTVTPNTSVKSESAALIPRTKAPVSVSKPIVEHAAISATAPAAETVATTPLTSMPTPIAGQTVPQPQKNAVAWATPTIVVNTPAIFDAAYLNNPSPRYPEVSRLRGEAGTTLLHVQINAEGKASDVNVSKTSGSSKLDQAAVSAVLKWRFVPAKRAGVATSSWVTIPIEFSLSSLNK